MTRIIGSGGGGGCFPAGTMVMTLEGEKAIETMQAGDEVMSFSDTGRVSISTVTKVHVHPSDTICRIEYWGGSLRTTANHWVLNQYNTFALAGTMTEHDALIDGLGHLRPVLEIHEDEPEPVYNLTVTPDHTFIADNVRVHNGGRGATRPVVGGGGGDGGKGGGGSSRTPVESPDSLQSHQYAQIIDLLSEGEIGGLVNGLRSVYLNDTPIQAADGTMNFTGITLDYRNGTNDQTNISGFTDVENEISINTRVNYGTPVVRTISGSIDAIRVTIGIPQLTNQNMTNGDLNGTSVQLSIDVQDSGAGYKSVPVGYQWATGNATISGLQVNSASAFGVGMTVNGAFPYTVAGGYAYDGDGNAYYQEQVTYSPLSWRIEYLPPGGSWTILKTEYVPTNGAASVAMTYYTPQGAEGAWSIRAILLSGGSIGVSGTTLVYNYVDTISGKTTSRYKRSYEIKLTGTGPWDVRVTRVTADSTANNIQNQTWWDSLAEIIDSKLSYPNSAIVAASIDAEQFANIPSRGYEIYGILCQVPSNYDPVSRVYTGVWNGTFQVLWTDNPAWVFYDLLTNERYGLGAYIEVGNLDKWALYDIAQYCDELVPSGFGYMEPRYTCNLYIQTREDAFKILTSMTSIFRGMSYWSAGQVTTLSDMPSDAIGIFTNANVIDGSFSYAGSSKSVRHTVALVTWNDPKDMYRQKVEYVEDTSGILKYGINQTEVIAFGCTSKGQAHRLGKWILYTERLETEVISFKTGMDGTAVYPGAVIKVADTLRSGDRIGGRVVAALAGSVTLDSSVTLTAGLTYTLSAIMPSGAIEDRTVTTAAGLVSVLDVTPNFSYVPQVNSMWVLASASLVPQTFRVVSVAESGKAMLEVTALQHDPNKFAMVELDQHFAEAPISSLPATAPSAPSNLIASDTLYLVGPGLVGTKVHFSWVSIAPRFEVRWRQGANNYKLLDSTTNYADIAPVNEEAIDLAVRAIDVLGRSSGWATLEYTVLGKQVPPSDVLNFVVTKQPTNLLITWDSIPDLDVAGYEVRVGSSWTVSDLLITNFMGNMVTHDQSAAGTYNYFIRAIDTSGNYSPNVTTYVLVLAAPAIVTSFDCVQSGPRLEFRWDANPEPDIAYYELREGDVWGTANYIAQVSATGYSVPSGVSGDRTFVIKAVAAPGIYGQIATFVTTAVAQPTDRNIIWSSDRTALGYPGVKRGLNHVASTLRIATAPSKGEHFFSIDLGANYRAQVGVRALFDALAGAGETWSSSTFTWDSAHAMTAPWLDYGDTSFTTSALQFSRHIGLRVGEIDGWAMDNSLTSANGVVAGTSISVSYADGRYNEGVKVGDFTSVAWPVAIPPEFRYRFWVSPILACNSVLLKLDGGSGSLEVRYSSDRSELHLDGGGLTQIIHATLSPSEQYLIALAQTPTDRKFAIANIDGTLTELVSNTHAPQGSFTSMSLH